MSIHSIQYNPYITRDYAAEVSSHSFKGMCWRISEIAMKVMAFVLPVAAVVLSAIFYPTGLPLISLAALFGCFKLWDWGVSLGKSAQWHSVKHQLTSTIAQEIINMQNDPQYALKVIKAIDVANQVDVDVIDVAKQAFFMCETAKMRENLQDHKENMFPLLAQLAIALKTFIDILPEYTQALMNLKELNAVDLSKLDDAEKSKHHEKIRAAVDKITSLKFTVAIAKVEFTFFAFLAANPTSKWTLSGDHDASDSYQTRESRRDTDLIRLNTHGNLRHNQGIITFAREDSRDTFEDPRLRANAFNQIIEAFGAQFCTLPTIKRMCTLTDVYSDKFYTCLKSAAEATA